MKISNQYKKWMGFLSLALLVVAVTQLGYVDMAYADITSAMTKSSNEALAATNAGLKYLYIFSLISFLIGIASFMPGIRQPGWGAAAIVVSLLSLSAPSCINTFNSGNTAQLGDQVK